MFKEKLVITEDKPLPESDIKLIFAARSKDL